MSSHEAGQEDEANQVLILVHPGSACGSADFNLGDTLARAERSRLVGEMSDWPGGVVVIDGDTSSELDCMPMFSGAIDSLLSRAKKSGRLARRVVGLDPEQDDRVRELISELGEPALKLQFTVSGAWYHSSDGSGCVGGVHAVLSELGCKSRISEFALDLDCEREDDLSVQDQRFAHR